MAEYVLGGVTYTSPVLVPGSLPAPVATVVGARPAMVAPSLTPTYVPARPSAVLPTYGGADPRYAFPSGGSSSSMGPTIRTPSGTPSSPAPADLPAGTGEGVDMGADSVTGVLPDGTVVTVKDTTGLPLPSEKRKSALIWWGLGALVLVAGGAIWWSTR